MSGPFRSCRRLSSSNRSSLSLNRYRAGKSLRMRLRSFSSASLAIHWIRLRSCIQDTQKNPARKESGRAPLCVLASPSGIQHLQRFHASRGVAEDTRCSDGDRHREAYPPQATSFDAGTRRKRAHDACNDGHHSSPAKDSRCDAHGDQPVVTKTRPALASTHCPQRAVTDDAPHNFSHPIQQVHLTRSASQAGRSHASHAPMT